MGLDITAYSVPAMRSQLGAAGEIHYWRKHHALLHWCEALDVQRGGAVWDECGQSITLTRADLDKLEAAVLNGGLPDCYGGDASYWQAHDLEFIAKARAALAAGLTVEIVASW
jgi:hypothetical protein